MEAEEWKEGWLNGILLHILSGSPLAKIHHWRDYCLPEWGLLHPCYSQSVAGVMAQGVDMIQRPTPHLAGRNLSNAFSWLPYRAVGRGG